MKKLWMLAAIVFCAGCMTVRTYTVEKPRTDTDVSGNRGYLSGAPAQEPDASSKLGDTRTISVTEIEFGKRKIQQKPVPQVTEKEPAGLEQESVPELEEETPVPLDEDVTAEESSETTLKEQYYTVEKDDTLQKISQKFYKTTKKWTVIFDANQDVLKNPDQLKPGMKLKIPVLE